MDTFDTYMAFDDLYAQVINRKSTDFLDIKLVEALIYELVNRCNAHFRSLLPKTDEAEEDENALRLYNPFRIFDVYGLYENYHPMDCTSCHSWINIFDVGVLGQNSGIHYCSTCFIENFYNTCFGKIPSYFTHWNSYAETPVNINTVVEKANGNSQAILGIEPIYLTVEDVMSEIAKSDIPNTQLQHHLWAMCACVDNFTYSSPKANKIHFCSVEDCENIILPNEYYFSNNNTYADYSKFKMCGHCFSKSVLLNNLFPTPRENSLVWSVFQNKSVFLPQKYDIKEWLENQKRSGLFEKQPRKLGEARKRELFYFVWDMPVDISADKIGRSPRSLAMEARDYGVHVPKSSYWQESKEIREVVKNAFYELYFHATPTL